MKDLICECHDCAVIEVFASTTRTECYRRAWGEGWHFARGGIQICTECWAPCQQGEPCPDPEQCRDPKGCGHVEHEHRWVRVEWDFADGCRYMRCECGAKGPVVS